MLLGSKIVENGTRSWERFLKIGKNVQTLFKMARFLRKKAIRFVN